MHHQSFHTRQSYLTHCPNRNALLKPARFGKYFAVALWCLLGMVLISGCTSTEVIGGEQLVKEPLPRPDQILVYDFAATPADVPANSTFLRRYSVKAKPETPEQIATDRKIGAEFATQLAAAIRDMGLPGRHAAKEAKPGINDLVLRGYLVSVNEGSEVKRLTIGFGAGASKLVVAVEGFQMTAHGLRELGAGTVQAGGGKGPGAALGAAIFVATANPVGLIVGSGVKAYGEVSGRSKMEGRVNQLVEKIASVLKQRFQRQGWIN